MSQWDVAAIRPSAFQPRTEFPEGEIDDLARSIGEAGLLQPLVIRLVEQLSGEKVAELVAGERRLRAVRRLGWARVPVTIVADCDDVSARVLGFRENHDRRDLNPLEEARALEAMLAAGDAPGPTELARQLGMSQTAVSNLLRMLGLPQKWQERIASGVITPTHARALLPYRKNAALMEGLEKALSSRLKKASTEDPITVKQFEEDVDCIIKQRTAPLWSSASDGPWDDTANKRLPPMKLSQADRDRLGIVALPATKYRGAEERVTNLVLYKKLVAKHAAECRARAKDGKGAAKGAKATKGKNGKAEPVKLSPAELKRKAKEQADQLRKRLARIKANWLRYLIARAICELPGSKSPAAAPLLVQILAFLAGGQETFKHWPARGHALKKAAGVKPGKVERFRSNAGCYGVGPVADGWALARELDPARAARFAALLFWDAEEKHPVLGVHAHYLAGLAEALGVEIEAAWKREQCGPLSAEYYDTHSKEQLVALGEKLGIHVDAAKPKNVAVKRFTGALRRLPFPEELAKVQASDE